MSTNAEQPEPPATAPGTPRHAEEFWALARQIARLGTQGAARISFLESVSAALVEFARCDAVEIWITDPDQDYRWRFRRGNGGRGSFEPLPHDAGLGETIRVLSERLSNDAARADPARGAYLSHDDRTRDRLARAARETGAGRWLAADAPCALLLPLEIDAPNSGMLILEDGRAATIPPHDAFLYAQVAAGLGRAIANRRAQFRLRERIKELTCLHGIARIAQKRVDRLDGAIQEIVDLLPAAMQFPALAVAQIALDQREFRTPRADAMRLRLRVPLVIAGAERGWVEVGYTEEHAEFVAGAFLREETNLLESVGRDVALIVERGEADAAKAIMAEQLRHADRLATIGQLAAGVAHELNEPLANILGFAQLMEKEPSAPTAALRDTRHIVQAALHAREVVRKLLLFARQTRAQRSEVDLNAHVRDSIYFLDARCRRNGITMKLDLAAGRPIVQADPSQITQVVVNLVVNAIQAMPEGGELTVATRDEGGQVCLTVADSGVGIDERTKQRLFTPFFTTKDVGEGTGLGLSVVHGIVSSHGGTISVESSPGRGARFEVRLPPFVRGAEP